ncbi:hypothetical protein [Janthinobacterium sp. UMAB-56]|uniref:hypothetical protein n=1 Tax=Janthinobacterium sp. UMAB-56 TaxID=1365361 RepID=UPI001C56F15E|nr:hypothetical protein [Janthinobacterium sp. UMAB-56]
MQLDISDFPLVWIRRDPVAERRDEALFAQFEALLARQQAFVILSEAGLDDDGHVHPQKERKRAVLWMKRHKAALRTYIQGMVLVEPSAAKRLAGKAIAVMFGQFWGYPLHFGTSRDDALDLAQHLIRAWLPPGNGSTAAHQ